MGAEGLRPLTGAASPLAHYPWTSMTALGMEGVRTSASRLMMGRHRNSLSGAPLRPRHHHVDSAGRDGLKQDPRRSMTVVSAPYSQP